MLAILWLLLGAGLLGAYNGLLILDARTDDNLPENTKINKMWHLVGISIMLYLTATAYFIWGTAYILFSWAIFWGFFAGLVHVIGLKKPFFFVGTTASSDQFIRKYFPKKYELVSGIIKSTFLFISILVIILKS